MLECIADAIEQRARVSDPSEIARRDHQVELLPLDEAELLA